MTNQNPDYFAMLRSLVDDYENNSLSADDYRSKRKKILDRLDEQYNSVAVVHSQQDDASLLGKVGDFIKGLRQH